MMPRNSPSELTSSILCDETTFYNRFTKDLLCAENEVIIESPFITSERTRTLRSIFEKLVRKGVKVFIMTRDPREHSDGYEIQSEDEIRYFEAIGVQVFLCSGNHHRKLAMIDRKILWEGSLNILSQIHSREIMRRMESQVLTEEMFKFLKLGKWIY
ncbi:MAG TPA: phospholipase D-like domain-containing protein [Candidatus Wunengus sp. YC60]|uniref:phospholipase D-like domain-containing protein n=1 Tax=Candidatus Wunengus sp. YC60 TaxID=3367697 RepID=UPI00402A2E16